MELDGIGGTERLAALATTRARAGEVADVERALRGTDAAEAGRMLEKIFAGLVVREMQRTLPDGFFGGGAGADVFNGWLEEHLGSALAESGALELAGLLKVQAGTALAPAADAPGRSTDDAARAAEGTDDGDR